MPQLSAEERTRLSRVLEESKARGFLGPGPVNDHIDHASRFAFEDWSQPGSVLDLGSGGGLPGLVLSLLWTESRFVLLDAMAKRCVFLGEAVVHLDLGERVTVAEGRAEQIAHEPEFRSQFDLVLARSFGPPATTAECAAGFLRAGGHLVVSEPPATEAGDRWPNEGLAVLGAELIARKNGVVGILQRELCPEKYPRRTGVPTKRPLF